MDSNGSLANSGTLGSRGISRLVSRIEACDAKLSGERWSLHSAAPYLSYTVTIGIFLAFDELFHRYLTAVDDREVRVNFTFNLSMGEFNAKDFGFRHIDNSPLTGQTHMRH